MICLVTSQVISYIKARAEASGLSGEGGLIERPERLVMILTGAGLSGVPFLHVPWLIHVAAWLLAVASLITFGQRVHTVRTSPGAMEPLQKTNRTEQSGEDEVMSDHTPTGPRATGATASRSGARSPTWATPRAGASFERCRSWWRATHSMRERSMRPATAGPPAAARTSRVSRGDPAKVPGGLIRASLASYARYWREAFRLPSMDKEKLRERSSRACWAGNTSGPASTQGEA